MAPGGGRDREFRLGSHPRSSARCSVLRAAWSSSPLDEMGRLGHLPNPSRPHPSPLSAVPVVVDGNPLIPLLPDPAIWSPDLHGGTRPARQWRLPSSRRLLLAAGQRQRQENRRRRAVAVHEKERRGSQAV